MQYAPEGGAPGTRSEGARDVLPVEIDGVSVALLATDVHEVLGTQRVTPTPIAGTALRGVVPWRGRAIAVLDLGALLGAASDERPRGRLVVVQSGGDAIALPVDRVREPVHAEPRALHAVSMPYAALEVEVAGVAMPLFDVATFLHGLAGAGT